MGNIEARLLDPKIRQAGKDVFEFLRVRDPYLECRADAVFVLGGSSELSPHKAAELYYNGLVKRIAFISQGGNYGGELRWRMSEVDKYIEILTSRGIPADAIVAQTDPVKQTRNTLAEAKAAIPFMQERGIDTSSVVLVSRGFHQRRAVSTFQQQHPDIEFLSCPNDESLDPDNPAHLVRLVEEIERHINYGVKKADISRPDIPYDILRSTVLLRNLLRVPLYEG